MTSQHLCTNCHIRPKQNNGTINGKKYYKKLCVKCNKYPNLKEKARQEHCDICHKRYHFVQLDIDHINGKRSDDRYENLQVICANCHRLKSYSNKETGPKRGK